MKWINKMTGYNRVSIKVSVTDKLFITINNSQW